MKTCIIGVSGFGSVHYRDLMREHAAGRADVIAATVINQAEETDKCNRLREIGCRLYTDYRQMLDQHGAECDICFIPTGIPLHAPMAVAAVRAGCNVFVEKPLAATVQEAAAMKQAAAETGRFIAVGYQTMYASETRVMKQTILDGRLGRLRSVSVGACWPRGDRYYNRNDWAGRLRTGESWVLDSPFNNALAHQLNMICFLAGKTFARSAVLKRLEAELYHANRIESADTCAIRVYTEDDIRLHFFATHCSEGSSDPVIRVRGDKGCMSWTLGRTLCIERAGHPVEVMDVDNGELQRLRIFEHLAARLQDPHAFICDPDIAATQTLVVNAAHQACPIHEIAPEFIVRQPSSDDTVTVIRGVDAVVKQAFADEKLFSELAVPWAQKARALDLEYYTGFSGQAGNDG